MNAPPSELLPPGGRAADSAPGPLRVLFVDVSPEDRAALEAQRPRSWWPRFLADKQIALDDHVRTPVTGELLQRMPALRLVATRSAGVDHIDLTVCRERGIVVSHVPDYGAATVAEHSFALLLAIACHLCEARARALQGSFSYRGLRLRAGTQGAGCRRLRAHRIARGANREGLRNERRDIRPAPAPGGCAQPGR